VRSRAPAGVGAVQLLSAVHRNVSADGTVEMTETEAAHCCRPDGSGPGSKNYRNRKGFRVCSGAPGPQTKGSIDQPPSSLRPDFVYGRLAQIAIWRADYNSGSRSVSDWEYDPFTIN
jgi:hypothetical protein